MDVTKVNQAIENATKELNAVIDAEYADAKKTGRNFKRLEILGQAGKSLIAAGANVTKAAAIVLKTKAVKAAEAPKAAKK